MATELFTIAVFDYTTATLDIYHNIPITDDVEDFLKEKYGRTTDLEWMIAEEGNLTINLNA